MTQWLAIIRDVSEVLFFLVIIVITILSFINARKTLFQPLKTEIFKEQLKILSKILYILVGKGEVDLTRYFGFDKLINVNIARLIDEYIVFFFEYDIDFERRPYNRRDCPYSNVPENLLEFGDVPIYEPGHWLERPIDPSEKGTIWANYNYEVVIIPNEVENARNTLRTLMESPLLPERIFELLSELNRIIDNNIAEISDVLSACSKELPGRYPNEDSLEGELFNWIWNKYVEESEGIKNTADSIVNYIRTYYDVEELLK